MTYDDEDVEKTQTLNEYEISEVLKQIKKESDKKDEKE